MLSLSTYLPNGHRPIRIATMGWITMRLWNKRESILFLLIRVQYYTHPLAAKDIEHAKQCVFNLTVAIGKPMFCNMSEIESFVPGLVSS